MLLEYQESLPFPKRGDFIYSNLKHLISSQLRTVRMSDLDPLKSFSNNLKNHVLQANTKKGFGVDSLPAELKNVVAVLTPCDQYP